MGLDEPPAASWLIPKLRGWANQVSVRFGGAQVLLVGSSLSRSEPRDIDIMILVDDVQFRRRYGDPTEWAAETYAPDWGQARRKWALDVAKLTRDLVTMYALNVDLKVEPATYNALHSHGKPSLPLSDLEFPWQAVPAN